MMQLNPNGVFVNECWHNLTNQYTSIVLDAFAIMPNHIHGIVQIMSHGGAIHESPVPEEESPKSENKTPKPETESSPPMAALKRRKMLLPKIVGRFKMNSAKRINELRGLAGNPVWQRGYYEHVIRDGKDLDRIRHYVIDNPKNWMNDDNYPENIRMDRLHDRADNWSPLD
jgi:REP element-mobilizing transposase RayT